MDAQEIVTQLTASLAKSLQEVAAARNEVESGLKYAELTGRLDIMRTLLTFLQQNFQFAGGGMEKNVKKPPEPTGKKDKEEK